MGAELPGEGGKVVGWAAARAASTRPVYAGVAETSVYVGDCHRGRGASIALHQSAGVCTLGIRERIGRHHGIWRDTVFLERRRTD